MPSLEPEYPSLSAVGLQEGAGSRLAKSRRGFMHERRKLVHGLSEACAKEQSLNEVIGEIGDFTHANSAAVDTWLQAWRMPAAADPRPDVQSSRAVFVGIVNSREMPYSSSLASNAPHVSITTEFIRTCSRISEIFPQFAQLVASRPSLDQIARYRSLFFFDYLDPAIKTNQELADEMKARRNGLFSIRTTAAAVRWAIAHEMAHLVAGKNDREAAYARVAMLYPKMEEEQWKTRRDHRKRDDPRRRYRDEIACDLLAIDFILASPFATDDLITQVSGSLLALEALKWDGYFKDKSAVSLTHPSPTLRFLVVMRAWWEKLSDPETWKGRQAPGVLGLDDIAHWAAFDRWSVGAYRKDRDGAAWEGDIVAVRSMLDRIPGLAEDQLYANTGDATFRVKNHH